jgi:DNA-binding LytR/AlgR family response regulator
MKRTIRCMIVDDEEMATRVIKAHLEMVPEFEVAGIFHSGVEAFLALDQMDIDVLFLDIQMPKITGLSMLKMLKKPPLTVLTTAHREYALDGYELEVVDYLLKPIGLSRFLQTVSRLKRLLTLQETPGTPTTTIPKAAAPDHVFLKTNRSFLRIPHTDILHIEALKNHIRVVTTQDSHISLISISEFESQLPANDFLRIHRSYIVHIHSVMRFDNHSITHQQGTLPIGRSYKEQVREVLAKRLIV